MRTHKAGNPEKTTQQTAGPVAAALKKLTGAKDAKAREASLTPAQRREIARRAARVR